MLMHEGTYEAAALQPIGPLLGLRIITRHFWSGLLYYMKALSSTFRQQRCSQQFANTDAPV
eukprot:8877984-Heterocapsa_arctica.AAC.1